MTQKKTNKKLFLNPLKSGLRKKTKNKQIETPAKTDIEDFFFLSAIFFLIVEIIVDYDLFFICFLICFYFLNSFLDIWTCVVINFS